MKIIKDYLKETKFASSKILEAIWDDINNIEVLKKQIKEESKIVEQEYNRAQAVQQFAEDPDDVMLGVGMYWENYFGPDKEVYQKNEKLQDLTKRLAAREFSLNVLSGNILEHAKKGISLIYGNPKNWPCGRSIGTQCLSSVILESRNQSTHFDEAIKNGKFQKAAVENCFKTLVSDFKGDFSDYLKRDMAFDILKLLDWTNYENYEKDMLTII